MRARGYGLAVLVLLAAACERQAPTAPSPAVDSGAKPSRAATQSAAMTEAAFRKGMALEDVREVRYLDEDGKVLSFADFIAVVQGGRSFKKEVEGDKSLAVMTINPREAASPPKGNGVAGSTRLSVPVSALLPPLTQRDLADRLPVLANGQRATLVSFFFADCVPCIQEIPALNALAHDRKDLQVLSVTFETRADAARFARERGLRTAIVPDAQAYIDALGIKVYPTLVLVSPEGRLMGARSAYAVHAEDAGLAEIESWLGSFGLAR